jgi:hypothetical protein
MCYDHAMSSMIRIALLVPFSCCADFQQAEGQHKKVRVTLTTPDDEYVLGETVQLKVSVTNTTNKTITAMTVYVEDSEPEIEIYISKDRDKYERYRMGIYPSVTRTRQTRVLKPSDSWQYTLRVVYGSKAKSRLAFPKPGTYRIKVRYPLFRALPPPKRKGSYKREEYESNAIRIRIKQPEGIDLKVWKQIQSPHFLYFLQSGYTKRHHEDDPRRAVKILKSVPKSSYADDLRWALKTYYYRDRREAKYLWKIKDDEAHQIRGVTGITVPPPQPFPNDMRLSQMITCDFPQQTPLQEVLQVVSRQCGVTLRLHPLLRVRTMSSVRITLPLRKFMRDRAAHKAEWVRQGEGYLLKPADGQGKKKSQTDKSRAKK